MKSSLRQGRRISDLRADVVDAKARFFDYGQSYEAWDSPMPDFTEFSRAELARTLTAWGYDTKGLTREELESQAEQAFNEQAEPMMSYWYPLPEEFAPSDEQIMDIMLNTSMIIVRDLGDTAEEFGLALCGCGMDMTWAIAEAYIRLGYLPPFDFSDVPKFSGETLTAEKRFILAACRRTAKILRSRATWRLKDISSVRAWLKNGGR